jgi:hypothetical protein
MHCRFSTVTGCVAFGTHIEGKQRTVCVDWNSGCNYSTGFAQLADRPLGPMLRQATKFKRLKEEHLIMKTKSFTIAASALALGLAMLATPNTAQAQPMWDRVQVTLPYTVTIGDKTLQPGNYVIQQLDSNSGGSQVLLIYGDNGMKFQTSALTIPALQNRTQPDTRVMLHHIGNDYYFDKVWVQGKDYGYEFPLPNSVKQRMNEAMQPVSVAATASSVPANTQPVTTAQATTQPATTQRATTQPATTTQRTTTPQATTQPATTAQATTQQQTTTPQNTADRAATTPSSTTPAMPHTDAGWLMMLLSGGTLSGLGLTLRRKR